MQPLNAFRALALGLLLGVSALAQADVRPDDIANAVKAHNLPQAESLARQATQEHPKSAKAWYLLAQVEERLHKPSEGLDALQHAKNIDPTGHYAKSTDFIDQLQTQLNREQAAGGLAQQRPVAPVPTFTPSRTATLGSAAPVQPAPVSHGHFPWGIVLLILVVVGGGIAAIVVMNRRKAASAREAQRQDAQRVMADAQTRAMELQKTVRFEGHSNSALSNDVNDILTSINTELTHLKSTSGDAWVGRDNERDRAVRALTDAERRQRAGQYDSVAPAQRSATERIADADAAAQARLEQQRRDDQIRAQQNNGGYNPGYQGGYQGPQPVIINQGSNNDGLLTGVLLGEALSDRRERVVERDVYVDRGRDRDNSWDDDRNNRRDPDPAPRDDSNDGLFDSGSGGNNWDDNSNGGGSDSSVDSGSNDNSFDS